MSCYQDDQNRVKPDKAFSSLREAFFKTMDFTKKNTDLLFSIHGNCAGKYEQQVMMMMRGELPPGWQWIPCSQNSVVAATIESPIVYYKEFLSRSKFEKIKAIIRGSRCKRACKQAGILISVGLPAPGILCWGKGGENDFMISEGFNGIGFFQYLLTNFFPPRTPAKIKEKRLLLKAAGSFIGKLHFKGIVHGDLRQNNLLVKKDGKDFQFSFIDNESNYRWRYIPVSQIVKNLVQFSMSSDNLLTRTDLMRIFLAYRANYPRFSGRKERKLLQTVFTRSKSRILDKKVECDISINCQPLLKEEFFRGEYAKGSVVAKQFSRGVDPAQWFKMGNITLKQDKNITVKLLAGPGGDVVVKCFTSKNLLHCINIWLKRERVLRMWKMAHYFKALDIPIASPLGYVLERKGLWSTVSYFYSQYLADTCNLVVLSRNRKDFPNWLENEKIISRIARLLATLHNNGFYHGDTKWANILANANTGKFWLIDLDGASRIRSVLDRGVRKDLSRFIVDMIENEIPKHFLGEFVSEYCKVRRLNKEHVIQKINPHISRTLERHKRKRNISIRHDNKII